MSLCSNGLTLFSWRDILQGLFWPHFSAREEFRLMVVAVLGTTISPLREPLRSHPSHGARALARIKWDTIVGMAISNTVALAIMATAAATFHAKGISKLDSAAQAAEALRPLAGQCAFVLFALGIVGTSGVRPALWRSLLWPF